jgi:hypothetical protein
MGRLFLSAQTTCALLLGAGLLLRAQAYLRAQEEDAPPPTARMRPAQILSEGREASPGRGGQVPRVFRTESGRERPATRGGKARTQGRKKVAHRARPPGRGSPVAEPDRGADGGRR